MNTTEKSPTPADIFRGRAVKQEPKPADVDVNAIKPEMTTEEIDFLLTKIEAGLTNEPNAGQAKEPFSELGATAMHIDVDAVTPNTAQQVDVRIGAGATTQNPNIPDAVVDAVASTLKRADLVKQQEDLWGANDTVKAEDVPEGELTYEQYLAQRPVAKEGDMYHEGGRIHDATTGSFANKEAYTAKLENSSAPEHYQKLEVQSNRDTAFDEASAENETKNKDYDEIIRDITEGEFLVQKEVRLRALLAVGEELLTLYNSKLTGEEFEKTIRPKLEEKKAIYEDLYNLYEENDALDNRALQYIEAKTNARVDDPDFIPIEGSAYFNGDKVKILDFIENPDGTKAYTIEKADGSIEAIYTSDVTFKREFEPYEAPEEEKLSRFERAKKWFGKEGRKIQEFGGWAYLGGLWNSSNNWLTNRHIDEETMTPEQVQAQKLINRRHNMLGLAAGVVVGMLAQRTGVAIFDSLTPPSAHTVDALGLGGNGYNHPAPTVEIGHADGGTADGSEFVPHLPASNEGLGVDNPAYNIADNGGGQELFGKLNMSATQWEQHAQELLDSFPDTFYPDGTEVRIASEGVLPIEVRNAIEEIRNTR